MHKVPDTFTLDHLIGRTLTAVTFGAFDLHFLFAPKDDILCVGTVIVDGRRINSCLTLAVMHEGDSIVTIEGLGTPANLHPMQAAFVRHDGYQCGYCTPGQICSAVAVLDEIKAGVPSHVSADLNAPQLTAAELRERMSGNICRCGAYSNIIDAIVEVAGRTA